jgi:protein-L-isoaspartate(D-aspartate) O-methyltransferase
MITAGVPKIPEPLVGQLADGGLIVAPVGGRAVQGLVACEKKANELISRAICDVRFVRLIGEHGFEQ